MARKIFQILILIFMFPAMGAAQQPEPVGRFIQDTTAIGKVITYSLSVRYPASMTVVFPDSTHDFSPFEYGGKKYFPTRTEGVTSFDSVVYFLASFELDSIQHLALPVYLVSRGDSTEISAAGDSIFMQTVPVESGELKETTAYNEVRLQFNYPYLLVALGLLLVIALSIFFIFGKQIRRKIKLYRLQRSHKRFLEKFSQLIESLKKEPSSKQTEDALTFWKKYMEKLENQPYTKLTTKEITVYSHDQRLHDTLRSIDRSIYGGYQAGAENSFYDLQSIADDRYKNKIEEVQSV